MTIQERLRRSNFIMLVVPVLIAGMLLLIGLGGFLLCWKRSICPGWA